VILSYPDIRIEKKSCVMVDGSFDPIHEGHVQYFRKAAALGLPVLCNVAADSWTRRKHPIFLEISRRAMVLDAMRDISYVLVGAPSTRQALELVQPRIFAKGSDWIERGGLPEEERTLCEARDIEVVFLDTVTNSSSAILQRLLDSRREP